MSKKKKLSPVQPQLENKVAKASPTVATVNTISNKPNNKLYWLIPVLATIFVFFNTTLNGFVNLDDELYILLNTWITELSSENIHKMFTEFLGGNYHPLVTLTNGVEYAIAGKHDASIYHWGNYLLHIANTFLVYVFIKKLSNNNLLVASIVALLFGIHPMHVESVAWISERKDVLYSLFFLLALIQYLNFKETNNNKNYLLSIAFFLLSCLSKSMAVTLPLALIVIDIYKNYEWKNSKSIISKLPFLTIAIIFGVVALQSQKAQGYIAEYNFNYIEKLFIASYSTCFYILKLFVPIKLACLHPYPKGSLPMEYYFSILGIIGLIFLVLKSGKYKKLITFGILFFIVTIILVLQFISIGAAVVSERYTYIPYIGLFYIIAQFAYKIHIGEIEKLKSLQKSILPIVGIFAAVMCILSFNRNAIWKDGESLWRDCTSKYPKTADYAWFGLGNILKEKYGRPDSLMNGEERPTKEEIIQAYDNAIEINSDFPNYYLNSAAARSEFGDKKGALAQLDKAISLNPGYDQGLYNRGILKEELGDHAGAIKDYTIALQTNPQYIQALFNRAVSHKNANEFDLAIDDYKKVLQMNPTFPNTHNNLGNIYYARQQFNEAITIYDQGLSINANQANIYMNRGASKLGLGDKVGACNDFKTAFQLGDMNAKGALDNLCK